MTGSTHFEMVHVKGVKVGVWGWVENEVPDHGENEAISQVYVGGEFPDIIHSPPLPEPFGLSLDLCLPIWCSGLSSEHELQWHFWDSSLHYLLVLTLTSVIWIQHSLGFFHVHSGQSLPKMRYTTPVCFCSDQISASAVLFSTLTIGSLQRGWYWPSWKISLILMS